MQLFGRRYDTGEDVCLEMAGGKISQVTACSADADALGQWPWLAPGLLEVQINGYGGQEFCAADLTPEKVVEIVRAFDAFGVTRCLPTLTTESFQVQEHALKTFVAACDSAPDVARRIVGLHVEGPYITREDGARGAHPVAHCREPDWDEFQRFQEVAEGRIRILTLSPEYEGSAEFIRRVAASGVVVAIGHTAARPSQIREAVDAGARLSTHLGNGSHPMMHRLRNYIWAQLAEDELTASLIVDGHHLPGEVVKAFVRAKTPARCILTSDISGQAGQPPGLYKSEFCDVELLEDGRLVVAGQRELLAGAALPIGPGIANVMHFAGVGLADAVRMAVDNPARLLGVEPGGFGVGDPGDLVQFRLVEPADGDGPAKFEPVATLIAGDVVWGSAWRPEGVEGKG
ncbi:MAG: amidohydrolase family protein, partial [Planctomycetes bacterium]|nr:amidohydrolase family protein [Planctomycetota bacterium]